MNLATPSSQEVPAVDVAAATAGDEDRPWPSLPWGPARVKPKASCHEALLAPLQVGLSLWLLPWSC